MKTMGAYIQETAFFGANSHKNEKLQGSGKDSFEDIMGKSKLSLRRESPNTARKNEKEIDCDRSDNKKKDGLILKSPSGESLTTEENSTKIEGEENAQIADKIMAAVQDIMSLSKEDLEALMSSMGLSFVDLLNPENLKQLVLQNSGQEDITAFLTREDLTDMVTNLTKGMEELSQEISEQYLLTKEELIALLEETSTVNQPMKEDLLQNENMEIGAVLEKEEDVVKIHVEKEFSPKEEKDNSNEKKETVFAQEGNKTSELSGTEQFVQNLTQAKVGGSVNQSIFMEQVPVMREIVHQVVEQIKVVLKPEASTMELQLHPAELGRVNLSVTSRDGQMTASFIVQNETAREALESQIHILRENLEGQGLKVDAVEVTVSNFAFGQSGDTNQQENARKKTPRKLNFDDADVSNQKSDEDALEASIMLQSGNSVNFTA